MEILCFFAGVTFFYLKNLYPLYFLGSILFFRPKIAFFVWFLLALLWCGLHEWLVVDQGMPKASVVQDATLQGFVSGIPITTASKTQFPFLADTLNDQPVTAYLWLSCYDHCPVLHVGQRWQFKAKLKKPINFANPGGFDYVAWLHSHHLHWVGNTQRYTFHAIEPRVQAYPLLKYREQLAHHLQKLVPEETVLGIFQALTLGLTHHIHKEQWDLFRRTGTTHLFDISGEHIAMLVGITYWLIKWIWKRFGFLCLRYPAPKIASIVACFVAFLYALIAGFSVPTQRAFLMCSLMLLRHFLSQRFSTWQTWRYALLAILVMEPHAVFMLGFYFSFIAVAILILMHQRMKQSGYRKMLGMQLACLLGLMPLSLYWFSYGSVNGFLANLVTIPWVGFIIVPLSLIVAFLSPWLVIPGSIPLLTASIHGLLNFLHWMDFFTNYNIHLTFTDALSPLALMSAMLITVCLPLLRLIPAVIFLVVASLFPNYPKVTLGEATLDVLDVGQGLAIAVRTAHHVLLYDTGMKFFNGNDMGKLAIIPYLNTLNINKLDKVIISHPDLDHRGGLSSIEETYPISELIVDDPSYYKRGVSCHHHAAWTWDGVLFRFFSLPLLLPNKNNHSCVLQIKNKSGSILLSGDIEQRGEAYLIHRYGDELASTAMLIPHHGSKTSSSLAFLSHVAPQYAFVSYGFDNRYHLPHPNVLKVYQQQHIPIYNTLDCGMIRITLQAGHVNPECYR